MSALILVHKYIFYMTPTRHYTTTPSDSFMLWLSSVQYISRHVTIAESNTCGGRSSKNVTEILNPVSISALRLCFEMFEMATPLDFRCYVSRCRQ